MGTCRTFLSASGTMLADPRCRAVGNTHRVGGLNHCTIVGGLIEIFLHISSEVGCWG